MPRAGTDPSSPARSRRRRRHNHCAAPTAHTAPRRRATGRIQHQRDEHRDRDDGRRTARDRPSARCRHPEAGVADAADHQQAGGDGHARRDMAQFAPGPAQVVRGPDEARHQTGGGRTARPMNQRLSTVPTWLLKAPAAAPRRPRTGTRRASRACRGDAIQLHRRQRPVVHHQRRRHAEAITRSASESYCTPNSLWVLVKGAAVDAVEDGGNEDRHAGGSKRPARRR